MTATSVRWAVFAVVGLLVAVVVALLATHLVSEKIGISAEPVSAGESLVPQRADHPARPGRRHSSRPTPTTAGASIAPAPAPAASSSPSDSGESDDGAAKSKPTASGGNLSPAEDTSPPATPPPSGRSGTSTKPEPGDD